MIFIWMLPLALLPVLFHLFMRVRKQARPFPSLMFFLQIDPRLSARKKIREWLTMLLRVLAIAFLLLALSLPVWRSSGGGGAAAQVVIVDNSGSMSGAATDGRMKLTEALDAAAALVTDMRDSDSVAIILLVEDPSAGVPEGFISNRETLRAVLGRIKETEASGSPARAIEQALSLLARSSTPRREIHVLTDLQEGEWGGMLQQQRFLPAGTHLMVHRIASKPADAANVSIAGIEMPNRRLVAGRRYLAGVTLNNASKSVARIRLDSTDQNGVKSSQSVEVPARGAKVVTVPFDTRKAGAGWLGVDIENDAFRQDNHGFAAFECQDSKKVLFIGRASDFGNLPLAVSPSGDGLLSGLVPVFRRANSQFAGDLKNDCAMLVVRWSAWPGEETDRDAIRTYVEKGGNLLVVADPPPAQAVTGSIPDWVGALPQKAVTSGAGLAALAMGKKSGIWDDLRDESGEIALRQIKVFRAQTLAVASNAVPLLALESGQPLLAVIPLGAGKIYASGLSFDVNSSTVPVKGGFVALIHGMALSVDANSGSGSSIVAGARVLEGGGGGEAGIRTVAGAVLEWQGRGSELPAFARSGVYGVEAGSKSFTVAVRASAAEGSPGFLEAAKVPALADLPHNVHAYGDSDSFISRVRRLRTGVDLYLPLLLCSLLAILLEGLVVNAGAIRATRSSWLETMKMKLNLLRKGASETGTGGDL